MKAAFLRHVIPGLDPGIPEDSLARRDPRIKSGDDGFETSGDDGFETSGDDGFETSGDDVERAVPRMGGTVW
jgi:hypothetical protein